MAANELISAWVALCMQCAPMIHPATTVAIINVESKGNPYAIGDNTTGKSYFPKNAQTAIDIAYRLLKKGHNIDMGLMQVNSQHLKKKKINYQDLFDPCYNMSIGASILTYFYNRHSKPNQSSQTTLLKALSSYNTGSPHQGYYNGYITKILKNTNPEFLFYVQNNNKIHQPVYQNNEQQASSKPDITQHSQSMTFTANDNLTMVFK
jgi:type IV secretion system protein VirB1